MRKGEVTCPGSRRWKAPELVFDVMDAQCFFGGGKNNKTYLGIGVWWVGAGLEHHSAWFWVCVCGSLTFSAPDMP